MYLSDKESWLWQLYMCIMLWSAHKWLLWEKEDFQYMHANMRSRWLVFLERLDHGNMYGYLWSHEMLVSLRDQYVCNMWSQIAADNANTVQYNFCIKYWTYIKAFHVDIMHQYSNRFTSCHGAKDQYVRQQQWQHSLKVIALNNLNRTLVTTSKSIASAYSLAEARYIKSDIIFIFCSQRRLLFLSIVNQKKVFILG